MPTIATVPTPAYTAAHPDLAAYADAIAALNAALVDADRARRAQDAARRRMDEIEARHIAAGIAGRNEVERKAHLLLTVLDDPDYRDADCAAQDEASLRADAERRVRVLTEQTRLLRAALALAAAPSAPATGPCDSCADGWATWAAAADRAAGEAADERARERVRFAAARSAPIPVAPITADEPPFV